jgi:hypothetical protein
MQNNVIVRYEETKCKHKLQINHNYLSTNSKKIIDKHNYEAGFGIL